MQLAWCVWQFSVSCRDAARPCASPLWSAGWFVSLVVGRRRGAGREAARAGDHCRVGWLATDHSAREVCPNVESVSSARWPTWAAAWRRPISVVQQCSTRGARGSLRVHACPHTAVRLCACTRRGLSSGWHGRHAQPDGALSDASFHAPTALTPTRTTRCTHPMRATHTASIRSPAHPPHRQCTPLTTRYTPTSTSAAEAHTSHNAHLTAQHNTCTPQRLVASTHHLADMYDCLSTLPHLTSAPPASIQPPLQRHVCSVRAALA